MRDFVERTPAGHSRGSLLSRSSGVAGTASQPLLNWKIATVCIEHRQKSTEPRCALRGTASTAPVLPVAVWKADSLNMWARVTRRDLTPLGRRSWRRPHKPANPTWWSRPAERPKL